MEDVNIFDHTLNSCVDIFSLEFLMFPKKDSLRTDGRWEVSKVVRFAQSADPIIGRGDGGRVEPFFYQPSSSFMTDSVLVLFPLNPSWFLFSSANCCQAGRTKDGEETGQI